MGDKTTIILKSAFYTSLAMLSFFFLQRGIRLDEVPALRLFNFLFIFSGTHYAIKKNISLHKETQYWKNFFVGIYTSLLTVIIAIIFLIIYVNYIQPNFIIILQSSFFFWEHNFNLPLILLIIFLQGLFVSVISTYLIMLYWRKNMPDFAA